jgi:S-adenosylmethionine:tRNA ribosyltransferase-isomerase
MRDLAPVTLKDLDFTYPESLIATEPKEPCRIFYGTRAQEISRQDLYSLFNPGDLLVINDTRVEKRRVFTEDGLEILFLKPLSEHLWQVLFPAREVKDNATLLLPDKLKATLKERGLPQVLELSRPIDQDYFLKFGELALPPYIQKARSERHNRELDKDWYQTEWAKNSGSAASPTASLHFSAQDFELLKSKDVGVSTVTLHIGMGTFLPIKSENLYEHKMHTEWYNIPAETLNAIEEAKAKGARVWALGTTVVRTLEAYAKTGKPQTEADIFIQPGFEWRVVTGLLTNFHQPKSTLLALVVAFHGDLAQVKRAYQKAIQENFRLFSYGDLTVWTR